MGNFKVLLLTIILFETINFCTAASTCRMDIYGRCVFKNSINNDNGKPFSYKSFMNQSEIVSIRFDQSSMRTLTSELCETFPNLKHLDLRKLSMKYIEDGALNQCVELKTINFNENDLREIPKNIFNCTKKLKYINLGANNLTSFDPQIIHDLTELDTIIISRNYLLFLMFKDFPILKNLKTFEVENNEFFELDVNKMLWKFPNLEQFYMNNNPLDCLTLKEMLAILKEKNVEASIIVPDKPKTRPYNPEYIDDITCLPVHERIRAYGTYHYWLQN